MNTPARIGSVPPRPAVTGITLLTITLLACAPPADEPGSGEGETPAAAAEAPAQEPERGPRTQPGTEMGIYTPEQHSLYDGRFVIEGRGIHQVGTLSDPSPWDHMGDDAANLRAVEGTILVDVNEIENTGTFRADLVLPEGRYRVEIDEFREFSPCQHGGIAAFLYEHGNSGCGDANWPKSLLYVAGWGIGRAWLNDELLYEDYQIHFMVTQGMRDRETLQVVSAEERSAAAPAQAGAVNPAAMQLDFYIRSPERNEANHPDREVFDHFFAMEVTWR